MNNSRLGGWVFLALSLVYGYFAGEIPLDFWSEQEPFNARSMPRIIAACGIASSLALIVLPSPTTDWRRLRELDWRPVILLLGLMSVYGFAMEPLGFAISTVMFLTVGFFILGERNPTRMFLIAIPLVAGFWLMMYQLDIYLAPGDIFEALP